MNQRKYDPAFPTDHHGQRSGMDQRTYIATEMLAAIVNKSSGFLNISDVEQQVEQAVYYADKLLDRLAYGNP